MEQLNHSKNVTSQVILEFSQLNIIDKMAQMELVHEFASWEKLIGQTSYGSQFEDDSESTCSLIMLNQ